MPFCTHIRIDSDRLVWSADDPPEQLRVYDAERAAGRAAPQRSFQNARFMADAFDDHREDVGLDPAWTVESTRPKERFLAVLASSWVIDPSYGCCPEDVLILPLAPGSLSLNQGVLLHELAHAITPSDEPSHGRVFQLNLLSLTERYARGCYHEVLFQNLRADGAPKSLCFGV